VKNHVPEYYTTEERHRNIFFYKFPYATICLKVRGFILKKLLLKLYYPAGELAGDDRGRIYFYDNLRFLLIFLVVQRHFLFRVPGSAYAFTDIGGLYILYLSFLMPLFIFVTGFYSKSMFSKSGDFKIGRIVMFLALFFIMDGLIWLTAHFVLGSSRDWTWWNMTGAAWYMWACAVWYLLIPLLRKIPMKVGIPASVVIGVVAGYFSFMDSFLSLCKLCSFLPFFVCGYYLDKGHMQKLLTLRGRWRIGALVLFAAVIVLVLAFPREMMGLFKSTLEAKDPYVDMYGSGFPLWAGGPLRIVYYAATFVMCSAAILLMPRVHTPFTTAGARTLQIYIWHCIVVRILQITPYYDFLAGLPLIVGELIMAASAFALTWGLSWKPLGVPWDLVTKATSRLVIKGKQKAEIAGRSPQ
jgi:fucose 4-O-acetylase-like acetyltransferase